MKARVGIMGIVLVTAVLFSGALALGENFVWGCPGDLCAPASWTEPTSWDPTGYPQNDDDNASITSASYLIEYEPGSALIINGLMLSGDSLTWRKLHIKDAALTVNDLNLNDYAELDVDYDLTVNNEIFMDGFLTIGVANGATLAAVNLSIGELAQLTLTTTTPGIFRVDTLTLDARGTGEHRQLVLDGAGVLTLGSSGEDGTVILYSDPDEIDNRGKLWLKPGSSLRWDSQAVAKTFTFVGGEVYDRRADIDLEVDMTIPTSGGLLKVEGWARFEIAEGITLKAPKLTVGDLLIESRLHIFSERDLGTLDVSNY